MTRVLIQSNYVGQPEVEILVADCRIDNLTFSVVKMHGLVPPIDFSVLMFEFSKNITYAATYEIIKYSIFKLIGILKKKNAQQMHSIRVVNNDKASIIEISFELTDEQKDKLVDAAIKAVI